MTDEPLPKHELRIRAEAAVRAYRETGAREHLDLLRQDGHAQLVHDLTMERALGPGPFRDGFHADVERWLKGPSQ